MVTTTLSFRSTKLVVTEPLVTVSQLCTFPRTNGTVPVENHQPGAVLTSAPRKKLHPSWPSRRKQKILRVQVAKSRSCAIEEQQGKTAGWGRRVGADAEAQPRTRPARRLWIDAHDEFFAPFRRERVNPGRTHGLAAAAGPGSLLAVFVGVAGAPCACRRAFARGTRPTDATVSPCFSARRCGVGAVQRIRGVEGGQED